MNRVRGPRAASVSSNQRRAVRAYSLLVTICLCSVTTQAQTFQGLGLLSGGYDSSTASGVSADGSVVVGTASGADGQQAFRWTDGGGMIGLGFLPLPGGGVIPDYSFAAGVSGDGSAVVGYSEAVVIHDTYEAFRWTSSDGMTGLGFLQGENRSFAVAVSADGTVVAGTSDTGGAGGFGKAFLWTTSGGMIDFEYLPGGSSPVTLSGVSSNGSVVVGTSYSDLRAQAFRWTISDGMAGLGLLPGESNSYAKAVSLDGSVAVGFSGSQAFRWTSADGMVGLGFAPGASNSYANAVSADGSVVVGDGETTSGDEAFIWDSTHGTRSLQGVLTNDYGLTLTGWTLLHASGISSNGETIVGSGINPSGQYEAWIAQIPEPTSRMMVIIGTATLIGLRRRHRMTKEAGAFVRELRGTLRRI
jgi:probable HAF family extracellular repeat protein